MLTRTLGILKQERLTQSSAVIVGLVLVLVMHAPIIPVVIGCVLAIGIIVVRRLYGGKKRIEVRGR